MDIRRIISKQVCNQYQEEEYVYPSQLHQNTFTIAVIDNLDHNFTFATATSSYNGATIPFFQQYQSHHFSVRHSEQIPQIKKKIKN